MEYETGIFKRYDKKRGKGTVTQVGVTGLSVNSKFKNNEELFILSKDDLTQIQKQIQKIDKLELDLTTANTKIENLESQLSTSNSMVKDLQNQLSTTPETLPVQYDNPKYYDQLLTAKDEVNNLKETINNRNELLFNTQDKVNSLIDELTTEIKQVYDTEITEARTKTVTNINLIIGLIQDTYKQINQYNNELGNLEKDHNTNIDNSSLVTRVLHKDNLKLQLDTGKLQDLENKFKSLNDNCTNYNAIVKPIEIPASKITEIKLNAKNNKLDIKELYISTGNKDDDNSIIVTPKPNEE